MSEEKINEIVKEHYGFTVDEVDESIGYWCTKWAKLKQENQQLIKEKIRLLVIIQKALKTNAINSEDMEFITKLHKELGSAINE